MVHLETGLLTEREENEFAEALTELIVNDAKHRFMSQRAVEVIRYSWTLEYTVRKLLCHLARAIKV